MVLVMGIHRRLWARDAMLAMASSCKWYKLHNSGVQSYHATCNIIVAYIGHLCCHLCGNHLTCWNIWLNRNYKSIQSFLHIQACLHIMWSHGWTIICWINNNAESIHHDKYCLYSTVVRLTHTLNENKTNHLNPWPELLLCIILAAVCN